MQGQGLRFPFNIHLQAPRNTMRFMSKSTACAEEEDLTLASTNTVSRGCWTYPCGTIHAAPKFLKHASSEEDNRVTKGSQLDVFPGFLPASLQPCYSLIRQYVGVQTIQALGCLLFTGFPIMLTQPTCRTGPSMRLAGVVASGR